MVSEKQKGYRNKWDAANMTVLGCKVRKEKAEYFKALCKNANTTPNAVFTQAMDAFIEEHESAPLQLIAEHEETGGD